MCFDFLVIIELEYVVWFECLLLFVGVGVIVYYEYRVIVWVFYRVCVMIGKEWFICWCLYFILYFVVEWLVKG